MHKSTATAYTQFQKSNVKRKKLGSLLFKKGLRGKFNNIEVGQI